MGLDVRAIEHALLTGKWDDRLSASEDAPVVKFAHNVDELLRLVCAVACLHAFLQVNWTGPDLDIKPLDILALNPELSQVVNEDLLHQKTVAELAYGGEPAYHLAKAPLFLLLAKLLLDTSFQHIESAPWWRLRTWRVHQQVLDEPVAIPSDVMESVVPLLDSFATEPDIAGRLLLEQGLLEHYVGHDKSAADYFVRAARATQLEYELTGALGKRTKFQQTELTQLILLAESRKRGDGDGDGADANLETGGATHEGGDSTTGTAGPSPPDAAIPAIPETLALNDDTLLEQTAFTSSSTAGTPGSRLSHIDPASQPALHPLDQSILLALCLNVKNLSPAHGLTTEQMAPYVARVLSHPRNWSVHTMALLLRSRLEAHRTRTVERATLQLQALVDQMPTADSPLAERLLLIHAIVLPSRWEMERELALRFLSIGVVKSALEIFERLEMWEEVVRCWQSMERTDKAVSIVRDLLEGRKAEADTVIARGKAAFSATRMQVRDATREAKLWCLLGDLEPERGLEHYTRAWEVSKASSGRAMRSLGGYYFARGNYPDAVTCLRRAVAINPLLSRSWFVLGCALVRQEDWEGARDAFVRCVTIDDEDGESWNNLASMYLRMGEAGKTAAENAAREGRPEDAEKRIPFSNKLLAFRALKQGLKYAYDNWRMWTNYMIVAVDVGEFSEACRALTRVVEHRAAKDGAACVDEDVLDKLVDAVTRGTGEAGSHGGEGIDELTAGTSKVNTSTGLGRRVTDLFEGTILPRVSSPRIFRARARLLTAEGRYEDALNAYLDGYRAGPAGTMERGETDVEKWREAVGEVEEIVDVLRNFGPRVDGFKWKLQARSIVRTFMGRTKDFGDEPEWARLTTLQEEIRKED
ncbi:tetratricopeptide repeat domain 27 [Trametes versicolor FP-101664 SS1]|uniref:tetratricopeptide repeat domain 27 n=1 Tax=Trametes versicolor (strain FP-101664) TaxID=717944 RepID=UPI0004623B7B|nr:tetratricopeptide repeat domain 27 [Trametes versicolor FP-101664 SS1]EIW61519.1 tetratricopeptide repeat domain 27 [Trametes versicolor FP-101664 SS1]